MKYVLYLAWAWEILIGALLITPGGVLCIRGAAVESPGYIGRPATVFFGVVAIALGVIGFATAGRSFSSGAAR